jgi:uncharacterized protein (UPF0335 family)
MAKEKLKTTDEESAGVGHNSGGVSGALLKSFIERIEHLTEEKTAIAEDIRDVYSEAKGTGFEPKIIRKLVSIRKQNKEKRHEERELLELYASAIQMELDF